MMKNYFYLLFLMGTLLIGSKVYSQNVALDFDGVNDFVQTNLSGITGNNPRTIEAWIKTSKNSLPPGSGGAGQSVLVDWGSTGTGNRFTFNLLWSNAIRLEVAGNGLSGTIPVNDGLWHHVAVTYNPATNPSVYLYVDGVLDVSGNISVTVNTTSTNPIQIGRRIDNINHFEGSMDEVRIFNTAKDSMSIYNNMNQEFCGTLPADLVAYYKLNDGLPNGSNGANSAAIETVAGNNGTLQSFSLNGTTSNWVAGPSIIGGNEMMIDTSVCQSYTSPSGSFTWSNSGTYMDTLLNLAGCDTIVTVNLTVLNSHDTISMMACDSFVSPNGTSLMSSGMLTDSFTTGSACDSLLTYDVTINYSTSVSDSVFGCGSVAYNGVTYYSDTTIVLNETTSNGCDSLVTSSVTIGGFSATFDTIQACDSALIEGDWYFDSRTILIATTNILGCDSTHTIELAVDSFRTNMNVSSTFWTITISGIQNSLFTWYDCENDSLIIADSTGFFQGYEFNSYYYCEITSENCNNITECYHIVGEGINEVYNSAFELYPNPNEGSFLVDLGKESKAISYQIFDLFGRVVESKEIVSLSTFNIQSKLGSGMYYIIIETENESFGKIFIVK